MGLDAVELLIVIEDEFQIAISDEEASQCETPRLLTELVYSKLRQSESDTCPPMHGFYIVRKVLISQLGISRSAIKPDTKLTALIDKKSRIISWKKLLSALSNGQSIYAPLKKPHWIKIAIFISSIVVFFCAFLLTDSILLSFLIAGFNSAVINTATVPFKTEFPNKFVTVKDLARVVSTLDSKVWQHEQVYSRIKFLIVEQLGVESKDVFPDSHFVNDLGMN